MHDRIVIVGYDGRPQSEDALALGAMLARTADGRLLITHTHQVGETTGFGRLLYEASCRVPYGVRVEARAVAADSPARALATLADAELAAVIVVGSCHRGPVGRVLMGSVAEQLLREAPCAVAVAPSDFSERPPRQVHTVAVGFDGQPESLYALEHGAAMAMAFGARLRLIAVVENPDPGAVLDSELLAERRQALNDALENAAASLPPELPVDRELLVGPPATVLSEACREGVDLLVSGSHGYGPLRRMLLGSVSTQLMRSCPCPLYVVPRSAAESSASAAA
jgi:nucleotide-binding universal stress UspA family protein